MDGTVARLDLKPRAEAAFRQSFAAFHALNVPGYVGDSVYQMDADPHEVFLCVLFESKAAYHANAWDPRQDCCTRRCGLF